MPAPASAAAAILSRAKPGSLSNRSSPKRTIVRLDRLNSTANAGARSPKELSSKRCGRGSLTRVQKRFRLVQTHITVYAGAQPTDCQPGVLNIERQSCQEIPIRLSPVIGLHSYLGDAVL